MLEITQRTEWGRARVLIAVDDLGARWALTDILHARRDIAAFDCAESAAETLDKLREKRHELLLLDLHLPDSSGLEFVERLSKRHQPMPAIICITTHLPHVAPALEKHAVDYVLKPYSSQRIHEALNLAIRRVTDDRAAIVMEILPHMRSLAPRPAKIAIKIEGRILFIDPAEVISAEAQGNYVLLVKSSGTYLVRGSLSKIDEQLRAYGFIRIHRSILVNGSWVRDLQPNSAGGYLLRTSRGAEYTVSRSYKDNLRALAGFWLGGDPLFPEKTNEPPGRHPPQPALLTQD